MNSLLYPTLLSPMFHQQSTANKQTAASDRMMSSLLCVCLSDVVGERQWTCVTSFHFSEYQQHHRNFLRPVVVLDSPTDELTQDQTNRATLPTLSKQLHLNPTLRSGWRCSCCPTGPCLNVNRRQFSFVYMALAQSPADKTLGQQCDNLCPSFAFCCSTARPAAVLTARNSLSGSIRSWQ